MISSNNAFCQIFGRVKLCFYCNVLCFSKINNRIYFFIDECKCKFHCIYPVKYAYVYDSECFMYDC